MRDTEREAETKQREKQAACEEPDVGLNPRTPGSGPEPKADTQPLSHPRVPLFSDFIVNFRIRIQRMQFVLSLLLRVQ